MWTWDEIRARLEADGLGAIADDVLAKTRPEVRITATAVEMHVLELGESRLGGVPDLPRGVGWPGAHVGVALPFVAQLDLAALAPYQDALPRAGTVWLFADQTSDGGEVAGYPSAPCACLYAPAGTALVRVKAPPVPERFGAAWLAFATELAIPSITEVEITDDAWNTYVAIGEHFGQPEPRHACLGQAEYGSIANLPARGWTSLLRVDSDPALAMSWGDAAWIHFALPDDALADGRFDAVRAFRWIG